MRDVHSPSPQPEDPDRALDPRLEEDPDIFVELIDWQFYQLSCDDAMVAITAYYPGLLPASHVRKTKKSQLQKLGSPFRHFTYHIHMDITSIIVSPHLASVFILSIRKRISLLSSSWGLLGRQLWRFFNGAFANSGRPIRIGSGRGTSSI